MASFLFASCCGSRKGSKLSEMVYSETQSLLPQPWMNKTTNEPKNKLTVTQQLAIDRIYNKLIMNDFDQLNYKAARHNIEQDVEICGGWSEWVAQGIFDKLLSLIQDQRNREFVGEAFARAWDEAAKGAKLIRDQAEEHPLLAAAIASIIVLGILMLISPWVLEAFGFAELGPIEGSWAASWQSLYGGVVPKGSVFSYLQRLSMTRKAWGWFAMRLH